MENKQRRQLLCSRSQESQIAGRGAHIAILDDVMSEEDSFSAAGRRYVKEWYPCRSTNTYYA